MLTVRSALSSFFIEYRFRVSLESHWILSGGFFVALKIIVKNIKKLFFITN